MKLTFILLLAGLVHVSAAVFPQHKKLSMNVKNTSISTIIKSIEAKTGYSFVYDNNAFPYEKKISINANEMPVSELLDLALANTSFTYKLVNEHVIVFTHIKEAKNFPIKGTVTDADG